MVRLFKNLRLSLTPKALAISALIALAIYVALSFLLPSVIFSGFFSTLQLGLATAVLASYGPDTLKAFRDTIGQGIIAPGHIALMGITLLALGAVYSGSWGIFWNLMGQPSELTGTALSTFGRFVSASGFAFLLSSPDRVILPTLNLKVWSVILGVVVALIGAFFLAVSYTHLTLPTICSV